MKKVAIIGAGATGHTLAAVLTQKGHQVWLTDGPAYKEILEKTKECGKLVLAGFAEGEVVPHCVTTDVEEAVCAAELIVCCTVSNRDEEVARMIAPYITAEQPVLIGAGNCGSIIYHRVFEEFGKGDVLVGEAGGNFFPCRLSEERVVTVGLPMSGKTVAAFPAKNAAALAEAFAEVWELTPVKSIFHAAFNGPNLITHPAGTVLNISAIDNSEGKFCLFKEGISNGFIRLADQLEAERAKVLEAIGCQPGGSQHAMFVGLLEDAPPFRRFKTMDGPGSLTHRYFTEDIPTLLSMFVSVARGLGVDIPVYESVLRILITVTGVDYYAEGRTLENLGLDTLSPQEILDYFCA